MQWEIESKGGKYNYSAFDVLNELMRGMMKEQKLDHEALAQTFIEYLQINKQLHMVTLQHIVLMAFTLGYYYHVFLKSNDVTTTEKSNEDLVSEDGSESGNSGSSGDGDD